MHRFPPSIPAPRTPANATRRLSRGSWHVLVLGGSLWFAALPACSHRTQDTDAHARGADSQTGIDVQRGAQASSPTTVSANGGAHSSELVGQTAAPYGTVNSDQIGADGSNRLDSADGSVAPSHGADSVADRWSDSRAVATGESAAGSKSLAATHATPSTLQAAVSAPSDKSAAAVAHRASRDNVSQTGGISANHTPAMENLTSPVHGTDDGADAETMFPHSAADRSASAHTETISAKVSNLAEGLAAAGLAPLATDANAPTANANATPGYAMARSNSASPNYFREPSDDVGQLGISDAAGTGTALAGGQPANDTAQTGSQQIASSGPMPAAQSNSPTAAESTHLSSKGSSLFAENLANSGITPAWWWLLALLLLLLALLLWLRRRGKARGDADPGESTNTDQPIDTRAEISASSNDEMKAVEAGEADRVFRLSTRPRPVVSLGKGGKVIDLSTRRNVADSPTAPSGDASDSGIEMGMSDPSPVTTSFRETLRALPVSEPEQSSGVGHGFKQAHPISPKNLEASGVEETITLPTEVDVAATVSQAKQLLTLNHPEQALDVLECLLASPQANAEAWSVAGWAWWRVAQMPDGQEPANAATQSARALERALRLEPQRADLMTRLARCHLLRARHAESPSGQAQCLDQALQTFSRRTSVRADAAADLLELAQTQFQRSQTAAPDSRGEWLLMAEESLEAMPANVDDTMAVEVRRLRTDVQLALAKVPGVDATDARLTDAIAHLTDELTQADASTRDHWLHKLLETARLRIQRMQGGARLLQLQSIKAVAAPHIAVTTAVAPLLSWINLLDDWSSQLHARHAQARLAEADLLFERVGTLPAKGQAGIQFARAYYLRLRSRHEYGVARQRTLQQALDVLTAIPDDALPPALVYLERAEILLRLARIAEIADKRKIYRSASDDALLAAQSTDEPVPAWICASHALSELQRLQPLSEADQIRMTEVGQSLEKARADNPEALAAAARIRLSNGDYAASSELCDTAWRAGATRDDVLPTWRDANERWARSLADSANDPRWRQMHLRLRLANSSQ